MKTNITEKQKNVLQLIYENIQSSGFPPTLVDLKESLNLASNQAVLNYLDALETRGLIQRGDGQARAIKISRLGLKILGKEQLVPFLGVSACGPCLDSFSDVSFRWVDLPSGVIPNETIKQTDDAFVIRVSGDSMINAGIDDGDMLLIKKSREYKNGDIVVARNDDGTTVKRFVAENHKTYLRPENPAYKNIPIFEETIFDGKVILNLSKIK